MELFNWNSILGFDFEDSVEDICQDIKGFFSNRWVMFKFHLFDVETLSTFGANFIVHVDTLEREVPKEHPEQENPYGPYINFIVINLFSKDLRGHVWSSSTEGIDVLIIFSTKPQIADLDCIAIWFSFGWIW